MGNTFLMGLVILLIPVHPHGCGEHKMNSLLNGIKNGSSPRVWGTLSQDDAGERWPRFIPTGVGNTTKENSTQTADAVHPHGCGEHDQNAIALYPRVGSSPRVWGTQAIYGYSAFANRFIPTGVGNT